MTARKPGKEETTAVEERPVTLEEYQDTLNELGEEQELLKREEKRVSGRLAEIGTEVKRIIALIYGSETRSLIRVLRNKTWDRRISKGRGGGLDVAQLEARLGKPKFRELCCDRLTVYQWNDAKLEQACKAGNITDEDLAACTIPSSPGTPSIQLIDSPEDVDDLSDI